MFEVAVAIASVGLLVIACAVALRVAWESRPRGAWIALAGAIGLLAVERLFVWFVRADWSGAAATALTVVGLVASALMVVAARGIRARIQECGEHEARLTEDARFKGLLLRESSHRVKNNLTMICALLSAQSDELGQSQGSEQLNDAVRRIRSVSSLYDTMLGSVESGAVDLRRYLTRLTRELGAVRDEIELCSDVAPVVANGCQAIALGLLTNELVTNSLRHAFPDGRSGRIEVRLRETADGRIALTVSDNGIGFVHDGCGSPPKGFGTAVIEGLTEQLDGVLTHNGSPGSATTVEFTPILVDDPPNTPPPTPAHSTSRTTA